jgi:hypothetical protein
MSGDSPREVKAEAWNGGSMAEWPFQIKGMDPSETAATIMQASRQQLATCIPLGQQNLSALISEAAWHSDGAETLAARSAGELCRQIASIKARTMIGRLMGRSLTPTADDDKPGRVLLCASNSTKGAGHPELGGESESLTRRI